MEAKNRQQKMEQTAILGIVANLLIASAKIVIGLAAGSLAIISEGVNNASDAGSSVLTLIGTKLSAKHPDEKHPFGYGRIEYLTGMVIGVIILYTGFSLLKESISSILHPGEMNVTFLAIAIVAGSAVAKFALGTYTLGVGKEIDSDVLIAVGEDGRNDAYLSVITIICSLIFIVTGHSVDAIAGLVFAFVIMKAGIETLKNTSSDLIGTAAEQELAATLYKEIRSQDWIISAVDMMLHNYGPDHFSGSVNIEIDHKQNIGEIYEKLHALQLRIMQEHKVTMVFGIYAVDYDSPEVKEIRNHILEFVRSHEHVHSYHALYLSRETGMLYVDFIVDYALEDWDGLDAEFKQYMAAVYPQYPIRLTIETEYVGK